MGWLDTMLQFGHNVVNTIAPPDHTTFSGIARSYALNDVEKTQLAHCISTYSSDNPLMRGFVTIRDRLLSLLGFESEYTATKQMLAVHIQKSMAANMEVGSWVQSTARLFSSTIPQEPSKEACTLVAQRFSSSYANFLLKYQITKKLFEKNPSSDLFAPMSFHDLATWNAWDARGMSDIPHAITHLPSLVFLSAFSQLPNTSSQEQLKVAKTACAAYKAFLKNPASHVPQV